tara:strand:- start:886 stop:1233 length:348 start_codon:yes stop_codon:yes gene_type:complete
VDKVAKTGYIIGVGTVHVPRNQDQNKRASTMAIKKKDLRYSLHGDIQIDSRSNKQPRGVIGYAAEPVRSGGRVWRLHKNGTKSWMCDTVLLVSAQSMATALHSSCAGDRARAAKR